MEQLLIHGGKPLKGKVKISGAKNASLPIMAASLLATEKVVLDDVPPLEDVKTMAQLLNHMGATVKFNEEKENMIINTPRLKDFTAPYELVGKMRASVLVMGPLLARFGRARISQPGGCAIGLRPIDLHVKGMMALGAEIVMGHGYIEAKAEKLKGSKIYLDYPSVGATENIMMAAVLAEGSTVIENCAQEPEIVDLANFLNAIGGRVSGAGTSLIRIQGVESLKGGVHTIIPDRIEAGTFMVAGAITGGIIIVENVISDHLKPVLAKLEEVGVEIEEREEGILIRADKELKAVDLKTLPYPGFPTDLQPQFMALMTKTRGNSCITESVFENRFMHVAELIRMGADITIESRSALVRGPAHLTGALVKAPDLRAGAALVLASLAARGVTRIRGLEHIDRGYHNFTNKLASLGARLSRGNIDSEVINSFNENFHKKRMPGRS